MSGLSEVESLRAELASAIEWLGAVKALLDGSERQLACAVGDEARSRQTIDSLASARAHFEVNYPICVGHLAEAAAAETCPYCDTTLLRTGNGHG